MRKTAFISLMSLALAAPVLAGDGALLTVPDVCILPDESAVSVPVVLSGAPELRPSSLRTTLLYDPSQVIPEVVEGADGLHVMATVDTEAGRVDLVWHVSGRQPVQPLPSGVLAHVRFSLVPGLRSEPLLDLSAGETRSLDGNGRPSHVAVSTPATVVQGAGGLWIDVAQDRDAAQVTSSGRSIRGRPWILRGSSRSLDRADGRVSLGALEPLETTSDGRLARDSRQPEPGVIFYYLAARDDGTGQPVLGFDSECLPRTALLAAQR